jgi:hypothetical protein
MPGPTPDRRPQVALGTARILSIAPCQRWCHPSRHTGEGRCLSRNRSRPSPRIKVRGRASGPCPNHVGLTWITAAIESDLEVSQKQLTRLPMRLELAGTAFGIIFATMMLAKLSVLFLLRLGVGFLSFAGAARAASLRRFRSFLATAINPPSSTKRDKTFMTDPCNVLGQPSGWEFSGSKDNTVFRIF